MKPLEISDSKSVTSAHSNPETTSQENYFARHTDTERAVNLSGLAGMLQGISNSDLVPPETISVPDDSRNPSLHKKGVSFTNLQEVGDLQELFSQPTSRSRSSQQNPSKHLSSTVTIMARNSKHDQKLSVDDGLEIIASWPGPWGKEIKKVWADLRSLESNNIVNKMETGSVTTSTESDDNMLLDVDDRARFDETDLTEFNKLCQEHLPSALSSPFLASIMKPFISGAKIEGKIDEGLETLDKKDVLMAHVLLSSRIIGEACRHTKAIAITEDLVRATLDQVEELWDDALDTGLFQERISNAIELAQHYIALSLENDDTQELNDIIRQVLGNQSFSPRKDAVYSGVLTAASFNVIAKRQKALFKAGVIGAAAVSIFWSWSFPNQYLSVAAGAIVTSASLLTLATQLVKKFNQLEVAKQNRMISSSIYDYRASNNYTPEEYNTFKTIRNTISSSVGFHASD